MPCIRAAQRSSYARLLQAGVHIREYQASMMHAKTLVVDDTLSVIGSMNLDPLSTNRLEEGSLLVLDHAVNDDLAQHDVAEITHAKEMTPDSAEIPGLWGKFSLWLLRVFGRAPGR